jgi:hypothetical protein
MKRKGAELIYKQIATLSREEQIEYWRKGDNELRALFKKTQALPQANDIYEDMVAEEIEEYRKGK